MLPLLLLHIKPSYKDGVSDPKFSMKVDVEESGNQSKRIVENLCVPKLQKFIAQLVAF
jgi:hypothetical protein